MPRQNNCTPLISEIMQTSDGQPEVGSPNSILRTIVITINRNATMQNKTPITEATASGAVENAVIPSME